MLKDVQFHGAQRAKAPLSQMKTTPRGFAVETAPASIITRILPARAAAQNLLLRPSGRMKNGSILVLTAKTPGARRIFLIKRLQHPQDP